MVKNGQNAFEK